AQGGGFHRHIIAGQLPQSPAGFFRLDGNPVDPRGSLLLILTGYPRDHPSSSLSRQLMGFHGQVGSDRSPVCRSPICFHPLNPALSCCSLRAARISGLNRRLGGHLSSVGTKASTIPMTNAASNAPMTETSSAGTINWAR